MQGDDISIDHLIKRLQAEKRGGPPPPPPPPASPGQGDDDMPGPVEPRVARLEAHMEHVREDMTKLSGVPSDLSALKERVSHLPTKDELGTKLRNYLAAAGVIITIIGTLIATAFHFLGPVGPK